MLATSGSWQDINLVKSEFADLDTNSVCTLKDGRLGASMHI